MKKIIALSLLASVALAAPLAAQAQNEGPREKKENKEQGANSFRGKVTSKTADTIVVDGKTIKVTSETKFSSGGSLAAITVGDQVQGVARNQDGAMVATMIKVAGVGARDQTPERKQDERRELPKDQKP